MNRHQHVKGIEEKRSSEGNCSTMKQMLNQNTKKTEKCAKKKRKEDLERESLNWSRGQRKRREKMEEEEKRSGPKKRNIGDI